MQHRHGLQATRQTPLIQALTRPVILHSAQPHREAIDTPGGQFRQQWVASQDGHPPYLAPPAVSVRVQHAIHLGLAGTEQAVNQHPGVTAATQNHAH